jgi:hypothetical protein
VEKFIEVTVDIVKVPAKTIRKIPVKGFEVPMEKTDLSKLQLISYNIVKVPVETIRKIPVERFLKKIVEVLVYRIIEAPVEKLAQVPVVVIREVKVVSSVQQVVLLKSFDTSRCL